MKKENKVFIIAEAGCNHNGTMVLAKKLVDAAVFAKADAVKFQSFNVDELVTKKASKAKYALKNTKKNETQYEMQKKLMLSYEDHIKLIKYCKKKNIIFFSSTFDTTSTNMLKKLNVKIIKIPSGEIVNYPNLRLIGSLNKKIIISSGMSTLKEINEALKVLYKSGTKKSNITLLHCNSAYPSIFKDLNLRAMTHLREYFNISVGYSDHSLGIEASIAAVAMGAKVIEKHITLDKSMVGPDHKASLIKSEFLNMVTSIRKVEIAMGLPLKIPSKNELINLVAVRKSIKAKCDIKKGEILNSKNLSVKRPGNGITPMRWNNVIGKIAKRNFKKDDNIII
tara:strand:+ start:500 stop:1513 length:1014 start_codon:yes stop_codon:yes gene_type:complete